MVVVRVLGDLRRLGDGSEFVCIPPLLGDAGTRDAILSRSSTQLGRWGQGSVKQGMAEFKKL